jgi:hypothetical protein
MRERHTRKRTGRPDRRTPLTTRGRRRLQAWLMLKTGRPHEDIAKFCNLAFGTNWTAADVDSWERRGCPLD